MNGVRVAVGTTVAVLDAANVSVLRDRVAGRVLEIAYLESVMFGDTVDSLSVRELLRDGRVEDTLLVLVIDLVRDADRATRETVTVLDSSLESE
jgi:hypothetical protein